MEVEFVIDGAGKLVALWYAYCWPDKVDRVFGCIHSRVNMNLGVNQHIERDIRIWWSFLRLNVCHATTCVVTDF